LKYQIKDKLTIKIFVITRFYDILFVYKIQGYIMNSKKIKIEELLPKLLKDLSNGIAISAKDISEQHEISQSSIRSHLRDLKNNFYQKFFKYDGSTKKWVVIKRGFLNEEILKPEEVVILNSMLRTKTKLGVGMVEWQERVVKNYAKKTDSFIFKQHISETINEDMKKIFAITNSAIDESNKLQIIYNKKTREVLPYKIVYIEYYWYLICLETSSDEEKIKSFRLSKISSTEILDENFKYNFKEVDKRLDITMNAYVNFHNEIRIAEVFVSDSLVNHVELAAYFEAWTKTSQTTVINNMSYTKFEVKYTNYEFCDIVPTILKYMPNMIVESPSGLIKEIKSRIDNYTNIYTL